MTLLSAPPLPTGRQARSTPGPASRDYEAITRITKTLKSKEKSVESFSANLSDQESEKYFLGALEWEVDKLNNGGYF